MDARIYSWTIILQELRAKVPQQCRDGQILLPRHMVRPRHIRCALRPWCLHRHLLLALIHCQALAHLIITYCPSLDLPLRCSACVVPDPDLRSLRPQHWIGLSPNSSPWSLEDAPLLTGRHGENDKMSEDTQDDLTPQSYERCENNTSQDSGSRTRQARQVAASWRSECSSGAVCKLSAIGWHVLRPGRVRPHRGCRMTRQGKSSSPHAE